MTSFNKTEHAVQSYATCQDYLHCNAEQKGAKRAGRQKGRGKKVLVPKGLKAKRGNFWVKDGRRRRKRVILISKAAPPSSQQSKIRAPQQNISNKNYVICLKIL